MNWQDAQRGIEIGIAWFRQHEADNYADETTGYQDDMLTAVNGMARRLASASDMSVTPGAFDEHWQQSEWKQAQS